MDEPLPIGLGLRVPPPTASSSENTSSQLPIPYYYNNILTSPAVSTPTVPTPTKLNISKDGLCEFDELDRHQVRIYSYLLAKDHPEPSIR
jgi:hypothetical protein